MASAVGSAITAAGHSSKPIASDRNPNGARARLRMKLNDILYPGTLTSRLKRYAEPAPDTVYLAVNV
jgi:hypothetical protein